MKQSIITLGGGMVGFAMAVDLKKTGYAVTVADRDTALKDKLAPHNIDFISLDFSNLQAVSSAIESYDFVIGAVPGFMGYSILETVLQTGKNIADISFMSEDAFNLDSLAKKNGVTAITDAGVAPGLSNLIFGRELLEFDQLDSAKCFVGGLPQDPKPPWLYKSVFSPIDVIEEYTRPARFIKDGKLVVMPAMSEIEQIQCKPIGILEAFNSDGLRSLLTMPIPNMIEKTLRFPGHIQKVIDMRNNGLFSSEKIEETSSSLIEDWASEKSDFDQTIMRLEFVGSNNDQNVTKTYNLIDYYDRENNVSSMARTTGYTCTAAASLMLCNEFNKKGVFGMESLGGRSILIRRVMGHLADRNIDITENINITI